LSYNKSISFPETPASFKVSFFGDPPVSNEQADDRKISAFEQGKAEATAFYQAEIRKLREEYAQRQEQLLARLDQKTIEVVGKLEKRLPDLIVGLAERVLGKIELDAEVIEGLVRNMISEFADQEEEKLEVYLCPQDLSLLKAMANPQKEPEEGGENGDEGFASAIAGIFDGLDGDDALLAGYPNVKFFEDGSLNSGDCQIKSRFGLLDGRIATKLRKIGEELSGDD
jgi:flagellar biosynthesis/type III secretory pathway protein FliH